MENCVSRHIFTGFVLFRKACVHGYFNDDGVRVPREIVEESWVGYGGWFEEVLNFCVFDVVAAESGGKVRFERFEG